MAYRKWKEIKVQPGTAGPGNMPGCSLVSFHFLWAILCPQAVNEHSKIVCAMAESGTEILTHSQLSVVWLKQLHCLIHNLWRLRCSHSQSRPCLARRWMLLVELLTEEEEEEKEGLHAEGNVEP